MSSREATRKRRGDAILFLFLCVYIGGSFGIWRITRPAEEVPPTEQEQLADEFETESQYDHQITMCLDAFSGYAIARSPGFKKALMKIGVKLILVDDLADYSTRMKRLMNGGFGGITCDIAMFPIGSFIVAGANQGYKNAREFPARIMLLGDESTGADAILAYAKGVSSLTDLDDDEGMFYAVANSPSEMQARVVTSTFNMLSLPDNPYTFRESMKDVFGDLKQADSTKPNAFALWEPFVSMAKQIPGVHVLTSTKEMRGWILDSMVMRLKFMSEKPQLASDITKAYLQAYYSYARTDAKLIKLVRKDAGSGADALSDEQAADMVNGIKWINTSENYAHFGITKDVNVPVLEDMIANIGKVLVSSGKLARNPVEGQETGIYTDKILSGLHKESFNPGVIKTQIADLKPNTEMAPVRHEAALQSLTDRQWKQLRPVGNLRVEDIVFSGGGTTLSRMSYPTLEDLASDLRSYPTYYVNVLGHTPSVGNPEANQTLALGKAQAAVDFLIQNGVDAQRLHADTKPPDPQNPRTQKVSFQLGRAML